MGRHYRKMLSIFLVMLVQVLSLPTSPRTAAKRAGCLLRGAPGLLYRACMVERKIV